MIRNFYQWNTSDFPYKSQGWLCVKQQPKEINLTTDHSVLYFLWINQFLANLCFSTLKWGMLSLYRYQIYCYFHPWRYSDRQTHHCRWVKSHQSNYKKSKFLHIIILSFFAFSFLFFFVHLWRKGKILNNSNRLLYWMSW